MPQFVRKNAAPKAPRRPQANERPHARRDCPRRSADLPSSPAPATSPATAAHVVRINKALADAGLCSRRTADAWVAQGRVTLNGQRVTEAGTKVDTARDALCVDGKPVVFSQQLYYIMLNKPVHAVSTVADPQGRSTVLDFVPSALRGQRLYPVGRLDYFSEGLLLLTNDGALAQRMTHPRYHLPKIYQVLVRGTVPESALQTMRRGMTLAEGDTLAPVGIAVQDDDAPHTTMLRMTLRQGVNRQIRRMCRDCGLTILRLTRVAQGPLELGQLPTGKSRPLRADELQALKQALDL